MTDGDLELRIAWERHVGRDAAAAEQLAAVISRYREPHRRYHTVRHLTWVVRHVTDLAREHDLADAGAVVAAAFFHDAIYDPRASGNEAASAELARRALAPCGWAPDRLDAVDSMVRATAGHDLTDATLDAAVLFAADLAVLAAPPAKYADYVASVRAEYRHVTDEQWRTGRAAVLEAFLDRPAIYAPALGLTPWEARARGNLTAELHGLAG